MDTLTQPKAPPVSRKVVLIIAGAVVAALVIGLVVRAAISPKDTSASRATFTVVRGPLKLAVNETGELQAADSIKITPEIDGEGTIVELVDEGTRVKKGDVLVKLDKTQLEQTLADTEIEVENAKANLTRAQEQRKIQEISNSTDIAKAELAVDAARMELDKYGTILLDADGFLDTDSYLAAGVPVDSVLSTDSYLASNAPAEALLSTDSYLTSNAPAEAILNTDSYLASVEDILSTDSRLTSAVPSQGEAYQAFRDAELAITRAESELERAQSDFKDMDVLLQKGFVTKNDYIADELKVTEAERKLESARLAHYILRTYTYPKTLAQKQADLKQAQDRLEQARLSAGSEMTQKDVAIKEAQSVLDMKDKQLADTKDNIDKMTITAPEDGLILYGDPANWRHQNPVQVGAKVYRGQTILTLPRVSSMVAATRVQERDVNKVKIGQQATVTLPAIPGVTLNGRVTKVSSVASSGQRWWASSEVKTFDVEVTLDDSEPRMKPGMSCDVEILVGTLENILYVPVNAVFREGGADVCYIVSSSKTTPVTVKLGESDDLYVQITDGLKEGEKVLLYSVASPSTIAQGAARPEAAANAKRPEAQGANAGAAPDAGKGNQTPKAPEAAPAAGEPPKQEAAPSGAEPPRQERGGAGGEEPRQGGRGGGPGGPPGGPGGRGGGGARQ